MRAYANVIPGNVPEYQREDNTIVTDASQRPSDLEYDRYLWLVEEMKSVRYDDELLPKVMSFAVEDVFVSAILSVACTVLAEIGEDYKRPHADVRDLYAWAERFRAGVVEMHRRTNRCGKGLRPPRGRVDRHRDRRAVRAAAVRRAAARPGARAAEPAGGSAVLRASGPEVLADPVDVAGVAGLPGARVLARSGVAGDDVAVLLVLRAPRLGRAVAELRREGLRQASDGTFAEYYEPFTGEPLGSMQQSWTAAAVLDWLG